MTARIVVTTSERCMASHEARARVVAERLDAEFVPRTEHLRALVRSRGADLAYVISAKHEALRDEHTELFVVPGLFHQLAHLGAQHPLARACRDPDGPPVETLLDATLGLGKDALHLTELLGCRTIGLEISPALFSLVESGLPRLAADDRAWSKAASRITPVLADAEVWLQAAATRSIDVVYLDPMFETPHLSAPGFDLLRAVAQHRPLSERLLSEATRVARSRVVVRLGKGEGAELTDGWTQIRGKSVDYKYISLTPNR